MGFKENLRFLMDSKDIQIKELSQKSGISENTLKSYLKTASAEPTISKAAKKAKKASCKTTFCASPKNFP